MDKPQWYYARDGAQQGPVTEGELRRLAEAETLRPQDLVWRDGMPQWQPARQATPFFAAAFAPPPVPALAAQPPFAPPGALPPGTYGPGTYTPGPGAYPPSYAPQKPIGEDAGMRMLLPVGRSVWAIAAGYLGLLSVLGCFGPIAVIVSLIAIRDIKTHPDRHGMGRAVFGLVMGILGTLLLAGMVRGEMQNQAAPHPGRYRY
jgi:hypothetical protein